jgi:NCAIR mutase (PurE)-related protein
MDEKSLKKLLEKVRKGSCDIAEALKQMKHWPSETMDFACLDHHRALRTGFPEVVYGEDKSAEQIIAIIKAMLEKPSVVMATRVNPEKAAQVCEKVAGLDYYETAGMLAGNTDKVFEHECRGTILVMSAGTSDMAVAEEAFYTARYLGNPAVLIVAAGMEGALPSVVAGLVDKPVIAVPTSVGYGASFGGITALLGMLNSCAPGLAVVNIDNGFGAGCMAATINRM